MSAEREALPQQGGDSAQQRAVKVLSALINLGAASGLAAPDWHLSDRGAVEAHLLGGLAADLKAWADALGADVDWGRYGGGFPAAYFDVGGVPVKVWVRTEDSDD